MNTVLFEIVIKQSALCCMCKAVLKHLVVIFCIWFQEREGERGRESVYLLCHQSHQMVLMQGGILRECFLFFSVERSFSPDIFHLLCWECFTKAEWGGHFWWWRCQARDIEIVCRNVTAWFDRWKYQSSYRTCLQLAFGKVFQRQWLELRSTRRRTNSPTPTRRRIKSSRDVGELVVNPIQLIRS